MNYIKNSVKKMVISIQHGILEAANYPGNKKSAVIFNNGIILTTANILEPYIKNDSLLSSTELDLLNATLRRGEILESSKLESLQNIKFTIIFDQADLATKTKYFIQHEAKLLYVFNSNGVHTTISNIIDKLGAEREKIQYDDFQKVLLSSMIMLEIIKDENPFNVNFENFLKNMVAYIQLLEPPSKLDDIVAISSPFGMENFYKTINFGKVSNVMGRNNCIFMLSNSLVEGCEGCAIFNNKLRLIGIVITTSFYEGNIQVVLAANFQYIFKTFLYQFGRLKNNLCTFWKYSPPEWEQSLVLITNPGGQGTGIFIKIFGCKYILTCSHVVHEVNKTTCRYIDGFIECDVIWKNPRIDEPYDIALLEAPPHIPDNFFVKMSNVRPKLGQLIYNAGFTYFTNIKGDAFYPSVFEGRIVKYSPGCIISDALLQAGQSGGPMFDENGDLLGICVCNIKVQNKIHPYINIAVPICEIRTALEKYAKYLDIKFLQNLIAPQNVKGVWGLERPLIESKL